MPIKNFYPRWKGIVVDYAKIAAMNDNYETRQYYALTRQQIAILLGFLSPAAWLTRWTNVSISTDALSAKIAELTDALMQPIEQIGQVANVAISLYKSVFFTSSYTVNDTSFTEVTGSRQQITHTATILRVKCTFSARRTSGSASHSLDVRLAMPLGSHSGDDIPEFSKIMNVTDTAIEYECTAIFNNCGGGEFGTHVALEAKRGDTGQWSIVANTGIAWEIIEIGAASGAVTAEEIDDVIGDTTFFTTIEGDITTIEGDITTIENNITTIETDLTDVITAIGDINTGLGDLESTVADLQSALDPLLNYLGLLMHLDTGSDLTSSYTLNAGSYGTSRLEPGTVGFEGVVAAYRDIPAMIGNQVLFARVQVQITDSPTFAAKEFTARIQHGEFQYILTDDGDEQVSILLRALGTDDVSWAFEVREQSGSLDWYVNDVRWFYAHPEIF
jgi:hypothetical protein